MPRKPFWSSVPLLCWATVSLPVRLCLTWEAYSMGTAPARVVSVMIGSGEVS